MRSVMQVGYGCLTLLLGNMRTISIFQASDITRWRTLSPLTGYGPQERVDPPQQKVLRLGLQDKYAVLAYCLLQCHKHANGTKPKWAKSALTVANQGISNITRRWTETSIMTLLWHSTSNFCDATRSR